MSIIISNASPLIALARIDQFSLLRHLFQAIVVPKAVWEEVVFQGRGKPAAASVVQAEQENWLRQQPVQDTLAVKVLQANLGDGEAEAIVLAQELNATWILLDDDLARTQLPTGIK